MNNSNTLVAEELNRNLTTISWGFALSVLLFDACMMFYGFLHV